MRKTPGGVSVCICGSSTKKCVKSDFNVHLEAQDKLFAADWKRFQLDQIRQVYFGLHHTNGYLRGGFNGSVVKPTYSNAAHLACLPDMLTKGNTTLVGEQEATMARVVPFAFRHMINDDRLEWFVITCDKEVSAPKSKACMARFNEAPEGFKQKTRATLGDEITDRELFEQFCAEKMSTASIKDPNGTKYPYSIANVWTR